MQEIKVTANEAGQRLDKLLAKYLNEAPKSFLYKMLRKKNIVLNGKKATGNEKLVSGDSVKLFLADDTIAKFSKSIVRKTNGKLDILYEDFDILIINKPVGMLSQKAEAKDVSVVEHLITYLLESGQMTEENLRSFKPSICNRLDRNTSGLLESLRTSENGRNVSGTKHEKILSLYRRRRNQRITVYQRLPKKRGRLEPSYHQRRRVSGQPANRDRIPPNRDAASWNTIRSTSDYRPDTSDTRASCVDWTSNRRRLQIWGKKSESIL